MLTCCPPTPSDQTALTSPCQLLLLLRCPPSFSALERENKFPVPDHERKEILEPVDQQILGVVVDMHLVPVPVPDHERREILEPVGHHILEVVDKQNLPMDLEERPAA